MNTCRSCGNSNVDGVESCFHCGEPLVTSPAPTIRRGSLIASRYEIVKPLGRGGMGMVYQARDHVLEEHVAIKVLRPEIANAPEVGKRFRNEIRLARKVSHRNVCRIHEYGIDGPIHFISMEFVDGVDLKRLLRESGGFSPTTALEIAIQVSEGLQAIHEAGILHRDLKTANIMQDRVGVAKLMDFGIAKQTIGADEGLTSGTQTGQILGTPEYMSPEQARGEKLDLRSDIYSLGIVLYELFTGAVPFRGDTPIATILKHIHDAPPLETPEAASIPPLVLPVLRRALAKEPAERGSAAEMASSLRRLVAGPRLAGAPRAQGSVAADQALALQDAPEVRDHPDWQTNAPTATAIPASTQAGPAGVTAEQVVPHTPTARPRVSTGQVARTPPGPGKDVRSHTPRGSGGLNRDLRIVAAGLSLAVAAIGATALVMTLATHRDQSQTKQVSDAAGAAPAAVETGSPVARNPPTAPAASDSAPSPSTPVTPVGLANSQPSRRLEPGSRAGLKSPPSDPVASHRIEAPPTRPAPSPSVTPAALALRSNPRPSPASQASPLVSPPTGLRPPVKPSSDAASDAPGAARQAGPPETAAASPAAPPLTAATDQKPVPKAANSTPPGEAPRAAAATSSPATASTARSPSSPTSPSVVPTPLATPAVVVGRGLLAIEVKPEAEISVDGTLVGKMKAYTVPLEAGIYRITFVHPKYQPLHRVVRIRPDERQRLVVDLKDEALPKN